MLPVNFLVEGLVDEIVLRRIVSLFEQLSPNVFYGLRGIDYIIANIAPFSRTANPACPMVCLVDLDSDLCPVTRVRELRPSDASSSFILRIAVRTVESWLLADARGFAHWAGVPLAKIPSASEDDPAPKGTLIALVRQYSAPALKRDIVPEAGSTAKVGKAYVPRIQEFVTSSWNPEAAAANAPSLARALAALARLSPPS
jgi:hypothetical protein